MLTFINIDEVGMAFLREIAGKLKMDAVTLLSDFSVNVYGGKGVHVEGHKGVGYMADDEIVFKTKKGLVTIKGKGLKILEIGTTDAYVTGKIEDVVIGGRGE